MVVYEKHGLKVEKHDVVQGYTVFGPDGLCLAFYINKKEAIKRLNKELRKGIFIRIPMKNYLYAQTVVKVMKKYGVDACITNIG